MLRGYLSSLRFHMTITKDSDCMMYIQWRLFCIAGSLSLTRSDDRRTYKYLLSRSTGCVVAKIGKNYKAANGEDMCMTLRLLP